MTPPPPAPSDGGIGRGIVVVAVILLLVVVGAIWYAANSQDDSPDVTISVPSGDPGTETTISP